MSENRKKILLPIAILVVGVVVTIAILKSRTPVPTRPPEAFAPFVRYVEATAETRQLLAHTQGTVSPRTETTIVAEIAGRVVSIAPEFASGGYFEAGDILLSVDAIDYELAVVTAKSDVAGAKVLFKTEEARARVAREEWKALGEGEGSPLATRELQVAQARAALEAAQARLRQAERNLERTRVRAPFACRVRQKMADVGRYVAPGTPVAQIYAIDYAEIRLPVTDDDLVFIGVPMDYRGERSGAPGPRVELSSRFEGERRTWNGRIVRIEGEIDPVSRMVNVVAQVDDPYGRENGGTPLAIGMFVDATIFGKTVADVFVLPRSALRRDSSVYVITPGNTLEFREVNVMRAARDSVVVSSGIAEGERVCVSSLDAVTDGMTVRTVDSAPPAHQPEDETQAGDEEGGS